MIKILKDIQKELSGSLKWEDVDKIFFGKPQEESGKEYNNRSFGVIVNLTLGDIRDCIEKNSNLIYFPKLFDCNANAGPWPSGYEHFGFTSRSRSGVHPIIHGMNQVQSDMLPDYVINELDPHGKDLSDRAKRIQFGGATNNVYNYSLFMDAEDLSPKPLFTDAFDGIVALLQHQECENSPYWFCGPIKNHHQGIKFSGK